LAREVVDLMAARANELGIELKFESCENLTADFDRDAMHQALLNVVTNALDATAEAASERDDGQQTPTVVLRVGADEAGGHVYFQVDDSGQGIEDADIESIFLPFESSKGARGTGLGLPVSRKVIREHGGDIAISNLKSGGASFRLHWPQRSDNGLPDSPTLH
jgi:signal transduction histidine kinase